MFVESLLKAKRAEITLPRVAQVDLLRENLLRAGLMPQLHPVAKEQVRVRELTLSR